MKNYYNLNLDFSPLDSGFVFPTPNETEPVQVWEVDHACSDKLKAWANDNNLEIFGTLIFWSRPGTVTPIHTDIGKNFSPIYAINWIYGNTNYTMHWYKSLTDTTIDTFSINSLSENPVLTYKGFTSDMVQEIDSASFVGPTLVRNDIPHSITNGPESARWCCSVRFRPTVGTWEQAVGLFESYLI